MAKSFVPLLVGIFLLLGFQIALAIGESCGEGQYWDSDGDECKNCNCNPVGSISPRCDALGLCECKDGVTGDKCGHSPTWHATGKRTIKIYKKNLNELKKKLEEN